MPTVRSTRERQPIDENAHMNDPRLEETRRRLNEIVNRNHEEMEQQGRNIEEDEHDEDESDYLPQPQQTMKKRPNRGGPIFSRDRSSREDLAKSMPLPVPPRLKGKIPEENGMIRQDFNPDLKDEDVSEGPITNGKRISNKTISNSYRGPVQERPEPAPDISEIQRLEKRLNDQQAELEGLRKKAGIKEGTTTPVDNPKAPGRLAARRKNYDAVYEKKIPPSQCAFYTNFTVDDLQLKKIDVPTQRLITNAKYSRDTSMLIDAVGSTLKEGVDIRDLTLEDWFYVLYWHKYNSYNRTPLILTWTSKYGNENQYIIKESDLRYINPAITPEQYKEKYYSKGLQVPTLREWELLNTDTDLDEEDRQVVARAQYFQGKTIEEKVDNYFASGDTLEMLQLVEEMKAETVHGVVHTVDVIDALFDQEKYVKQRRDFCEDLKREAEQYKEAPALYYSYKQEADEVDAEVTTLEEILKTGGQVRAEVETQPVRFNALDIFPFL